MGIPWEHGLPYLALASVGAGKLSPPFWLAMGMGVSVWPWGHAAATSGGTGMWQGCGGLASLMVVGATYHHVLPVPSAGTLLPHLGLQNGVKRVPRSHHGVFLQSQSRGQVSCLRTPGLYR